MDGWKCSFYIYFFCCIPVYLWEKERENLLGCRQWRSNNFRDDGITRPRIVSCSSWFDFYDYDCPLYLFVLVFRERGAACRPFYGRRRRCSDEKTTRYFISRATESTQHKLTPSPSEYIDLYISDRREKKTLCVCITHKRRNRIIIIDERQWTARLAIESGPEAGKKGSLLLSTHTGCRFLVFIYRVCVSVFWLLSRSILNSAVVYTRHQDVLDQSVVDRWSFVISSIDFYVRRRIKSNGI